MILHIENNNEHILIPEDINHCQTHPFSLCTSQLINEITQGHSDRLRVDIDGGDLALDESDGRHTPGGHTDGTAGPLGGTRAWDGATSTLRGGGVCVVKAYRRTQNYSYNLCVMSRDNHFWPEKCKAILF